MKKLFITALTCALLTTSVQAVMLGDVDGDGGVTRRDAMLLRRYHAGWDSVRWSANITAGDIDQNGMFDADDADAFSRYFAGVSLPENKIGQDVTTIGWETVMLVATDTAHFLKETERAERGSVLLQTVGEDGSLLGTPFSMPMTSLGLRGHDDARSLGICYYLLRDKVQVLNSFPMEYTRLCHRGVTDNDGREVVAWAMATMAQRVLPANGVYFYREGSVTKTSSLLPYSRYPYADFTLLSTNAEYQKVEIVTCTTYALGHFDMTKMCCGIHANGAEHADRELLLPAVQITDVHGNLVIQEFLEAGHEVHSNFPPYGKPYLWFTIDDTVTGFANANGTYNAGYVLYHVDADTGEVQIAKYIPDTGVGADVDSYVLTGVLDSYDTKSGKVTIDGMSYPYGYENLDGVSLRLGDVVTEKTLESMHGNAVQVLLLDGRIVSMEIVGE